MRILFFSRLFYPHTGGVEKHVFEVGKRLTRRGYKITVVTEELPEKDSSRIPENIKVLRIPVEKSEWLKKWQIWWWLWKHKKLIQKADVIHCHDVFFWYLPFRFLYLRKPVYTTFHGHETIFPPSKRAITIRRISEKLSFGNICVGDYIRKWYGTKPNYTTYGGVNKMQSSQSEINPKLKILFTGRLEEDTGIFIYLKTLELLKDRGVNFVFEACGDGKLRREVERWGTVHGFVENLTFYLARSDLVFASSYLSILEAMASKRLVLSVFDNPLKRDYLTMAPFAPFLIIGNDPRRLAQKIKYYVDRPHKKEDLVNSTYEWVSQQTWEEVVNLYESLYRHNSSQ